METLTSPDPKSRSKECEGRRLIQEGQFLYRAPTFEYYRNGRDTERKAQNAARQRTWREKHKKKAEPGPKDPQSADGRNLKRDNKTTPPLITRTPDGHEEDDHGF